MTRRLAVVAFTAVLLAGCAGSSRGHADKTSGITGVVYLGPQCPVEIEGSPCPELATSAEVVVSTADGSEVVTRERTDADGRFRIGLDPGEYEVQPLPLEDDGIVFGKPMPVTVTEGAYTEIDLSLDTGIR